MKKLDLVGKIYTVATAQNVALQLLESDTDGWDYRVEVNGDFARVAVYDETGAFLGHF